MRQVQYMGYIFDEKYVHVNAANIQVIRDWTTLTTLTELCSFLGLTNFYQRFVLGFSHIIWPLIQVTKGIEKEKKYVLSPSRRRLLSWSNASTLHQYSHY